jgi:hypothetical protein
LEEIEEIIGFYMKTKIESAVKTIRENYEKISKSTFGSKEFFKQLEILLDKCNEIMYKNELKISANLNFFIFLLKYEEFIDFKNSIRNLLPVVLICYDCGTDLKPEFCAKIAVFLWGKYYALLSNAVMVDEAVLRSALDENNTAVDIILKSNPTLSFKHENTLSKEAAKIGFDILIPLLFDKTKILRGNYNLRLRNDKEFHKYITWIKQVNANCMKALEGPPHVVVALIELERLSCESSSSEKDPEKLRICLSELDVYMNTYSNAFKDSDVLVEIKTILFIYSKVEEVRSNCLFELNEEPQVAIAVFDKSLESSCLADRLESGKNISELLSEVEKYIPEAEIKFRSRMEKIFQDGGKNTTQPSNVMITPGFDRAISSSSQSSFNAQSSHKRVADDHKDQTDKTKRRKMAG